MTRPDSCWRRSATPSSHSPRTSILDLAFRLWDAIAEGCHDELDLNLLRWTGTTVVADGDEATGLPN